MSDPQIISLAMVAKISSGKRPNKVFKEPTKDCFVPVIGGGGVSGYTDQSLEPSGVLITGRVGTLGKLHVAERPCWPSDNALVLKPISDEIDQRFLQFAVSAVIPEATALNRGAANPLITQKDLGNLEVSLFPLPEQREIAGILGALDDKIELNRRTAATLEEMARSLYRSWFVNFDPVHAKAAGHPPAHMDAATAALFPDRFGDDGLPEGWRIAKISEVIERLKVGKLYEQKTVNPAGSVPVLDQGKMGVIGYHDNEPNIRASKNDRVSIFANHTCLQRLLDHPFSTIQNVIPFKGKQLPTEFCHFASLGLQQFEEYRGHWPSFAEKQIPQPELALAEAFCAAIDPWLLRISLVNNENQTLATLRDSLLPRLMSGELRVGAAREQVKEVV